MSSLTEGIENYYDFESFLEVIRNSEEDIVEIQFFLKSKGNRNDVKEFLNKQNPDSGDTALTFAAELNKEAVIIELLKFKPNKSIVNKDGNNAFMCAVTSNHIDCARAIYEDGEQIDETTNDSKKYSPLMWATIQNKDNIVKMLLNQGATVNHGYGQNNETPLIAAAANGFIDIVDILLRQPNIKVNLSTKDGKTAFACAVKAHQNEVKDDIKITNSENKLSCAKAIYKHREVIGINISDEEENAENIESPYFKCAKAIYRGRKEINEISIDEYSPLMWATINNYVDIVKMLLHQGATVNHGYGQRKETPLMAAASRGFIDIVDILLSHPDIEINEINKDGKTAYMCAVEAHRKKQVNSICQQEEFIGEENVGYVKANLLDVNPEDNANLAGDSNEVICRSEISDKIGTDQYTPLLWTVKLKEIELIKTLLELGANVNQRCGWNNTTPLIRAAADGSLDIMEILLKKTDIKPTNNLRHKAKMIAVEKSSSENVNSTVSPLMENTINSNYRCQADIHLKNDLGDNALMVACERIRPDIVAYIVNLPKEATVNINHQNNTSRTNDATMYTEVLLSKYLEHISLFPHKKITILFLNQHNKAASLSKNRKTSFLVGKFHLHALIKLPYNQTLLQNIWTTPVSYHIRLRRYLRSERRLGYTALILAVETYSPSLSVDQKKDLLKIINLLCGYKYTKIELELKTHAGKTALVMAAEFGSLECVKILVDQGADVNALSDIKKSALTLAAIKGHIDIVKYLINEANIELVTINEKNEKKIPVDELNHAIQARGDNSDIVEIILDKILQSNRDDEEKRKILIEGMFTAAKEGKLDIFKYLRKIMITNKSIKNTTMGSDYLQDMKDGETVLYKAAKHGRLSILVHIFEENDISVDFTPQFLLKNGMSDIVDVLAKYYVDNEQDFIECYIKKISKNKLNILKMLPDLLVKLKSPTVILNQCFAILLREIRKFNENELLFSLVIVACALNNCVRVHFLEATDLQGRLDIVFRMIKRCMDSPSMDIQENVMQVLQDPVYQSRVGKEYPEITMARSFEKGPLVYCIQYDLHSVLGIEQISKYIKEVFDKFLSSSSVRPTHTFKDFFQIRSKFVFSRSCPLAMLVMEGLSKLVLFILILLTIRRYNKYDDKNDPNKIFSSIYEKLLLIWITGNWLHELGEYFQVYKSIHEYFSIWNALDITCNFLLTAWFASVYNHRPDIALILLSVSAIPTSLCLLRYLSASKNVGVLVLTIVAVLRGIWNFLLVFILILAGFGVALFGLIPDQFTDLGNIVGRLFYYALAGVDLSSDYVQTNTVFDIIGKIVLVPFVVLTMIVLMNLVIAKLSATFGAFQKSSMERWSMMKATQTKEFLLIHESNPLSMLPPPLNLITAALLPFHYGCLLYLSNSLASKSGELGTADSISAVSISGTVSDFLLRILYALPIFGPFHETFLCLNDVYTQSQSLWCLGRYILLSPAIVCCYVGILFRNAFRLTEVKSIPNSFSAEICGYGRRVISQYPTNRLPVNDKEDVQHTVEIKCLRYESIPRRVKMSVVPSSQSINDEVEDVLRDLKLPEKSSHVLFPRTTHYVKVIYRDQILETKKVEVKNYVKSKTSLYGKKNFYIFNGDESVTIELWEKNDSSYYSDVIIGRRVFPLRKWIANGRFEGKINLTSKEDGKIGQEDVDTIIGNITLVVRRIHFTKGSKAFETDQKLREKIKEKKTVVTLFTKKDKKRIFDFKLENRLLLETKSHLT